MSQYSPPLPWRTAPPVPEADERLTSVITTRLKRTIKERLDGRCHQDRVSMNQFVIHAITALLDHLDQLDGRPTEGATHGND